MNDQLLAQYASRIVALEKKLRQVEARQTRSQWDGVLGAYLGLAGLRAFWPLSSADNSGNTYDLSGQGRTLTYNGNPTYNYDNTAPYIAFDGLGDYLSRADEAGLSITGTEAVMATAIQGATFGGWLYPTSVSGTPLLFSKRGAAGQFSWNLAISSGTFIFTITDDGTTTTTVDSGVAAVVNTWYFVLGRFEPSTELMIQVNGTVVPNTTSIPASIFDSTAAVQVSGFNGANNLFAGRASLCFLCAAMLSSEICQSLYQVSRGLFRV